jgi:lipopolysaccharide/colanic/teichoic acid biosynthesis glycosyltransferase
MSDQVFNEGAVFGLRRIDFVDKARRTLDLALSLVLLLVLMVPMVLIAAAVRMDSDGPALFRQRRVGRDGRVFMIFKFRTMKPNCDDGRLRDLIARELNGEDTSERGSFKLSDDTRVTRIGGFLRRTSLDELPQILNVVSGKMSLVGPRPCLEWEAAMFPPEFRSRFTVRPGITGLWQVSGRSELGTLDMLKLDLQYVRHRTSWMDFIILLRTVPTLLRASGAR